ncbi:hypothetical protein Cni_G14249 [Canna indica]|uniref:Uncharacterized protein n=1 Tax=Canna indica TaxID=4628 RepID=A0AAQ3QEK1_9LILI|nr:hypothetical protein Cni_G14249 [Canna indica]
MAYIDERVVVALPHPPPPSGWLPQGAQLEVFSSETSEWAERRVEWGIGSDAMTATLRYFAGVLYILTFPNYIVAVDLDGGMQCPRIQLPETVEPEGCIDKSGWFLHYTCNEGSQIRVWRQVGVEAQRRGGSDLEKTPGEVAAIAARSHGAESGEGRGLPAEKWEAEKLRPRLQLSSTPHSPSHLKHISNSPILRGPSGREQRLRIDSISSNHGDNFGASLVKSEGSTPRRQHPLPEGVQSYVLHQDNSFEVYLSGECEFKVAGSYLLRYKKKVTDMLSGEERRIRRRRLAVLRRMKEKGWPGAGGCGGLAIEKKKKKKEVVVEEITTEEEDEGGSFPTSLPRSSISEMAVRPNPDALFEFSSLPQHSSPSAMCAADDIFHMGMLLPLSAAAPPPPPKRKATRPPPAPRAPSFDQLHRRLRDGGQAKAGEYKRLIRSSSSTEHVDVVRPRLSCRHFVLGAVRLPATMDMREIRSRQRRRGPAAEDGDANRGSTWRLLLRSLSCKGVESAGGVAAPYRIVLHVQGACP